MVTEVMNLKTGETRVYTLSPTDSVVAAYHQEHHNYDTWTYNQDRPRCWYEEKTVSCGDWVAKR
jgi:hypothetical protein